MKIALLGSTGNLGSALRDRLSRDGYHVQGLVHGELPPEQAGVMYVQGDANNYNDVLKTVQGCDAVIDVLGGPEKGTIRSEFAATIVKAMHKQGIRRIIAMGGSGILAVGPWRFEQLPIFPNDKKAVTKDHERVHQILLASGLDWMQICPSYMTKGEATGQYKLRTAHPFLLWKQSIHLADVADFIVKELAENKYIGKQVALINI